MNEEPAISVVTPVKDRKGLLIETMKSVAAQSLLAWEHILVDDGSLDGAAEEAEERARIDPRVRLIRRVGDQGGANVCRNLGLRAARADLVVFLDSDDLLRPDCLEARTVAMERNLDLDFAVFPAGVFRQTLGDLNRPYHPMTPGDDILRFLSHECVWQTTGPVWRRGFLEKLGGFDEMLLSMQDLDLHVRAIAAGGRYLFFPNADHDIRWQDNPSRISMRHYHDIAYIRGAERMREKLSANLRTLGLTTWSRNRALLGLCFASSEMLVRRGNIGEAVRCWKRGCHAFDTPNLVEFEGTLLLGLSALVGRSSERVKLKWKGWRRLRPEPVPPNLMAPQAP